MRNDEEGRPGDCVALVDFIKLAIPVVGASLRALGRSIKKWAKKLTGGDHNQPTSCRQVVVMPLGTGISC
ncbi:hypothetical protein [Zestomonas thermotolerans]|uniref:hypothetical protein n=1 Tax=Zestomonas thermotolerans TaxID=157784 RepID=UPI0018CC78B6|nr:hypothetical protein [Pseudomonas thermotolerans]